MQRILGLLLASAFLLGGPMYDGRNGFVGAAFADDDDGGDDDGDDDDDDDDDDGGYRSGGDGDDRPARRNRLAQRRTPAAAAPRPILLAVPAELISTSLTPVQLEAIAALGYVVLEQRPLAADLLAARLSAPAGRTLDAARAEIAAIAPAAATDLNHFYRPEVCVEPRCRSRAQVAWPAAAPVPTLPPGCDPGGSIGMIDTGINAAHEALAGGRIEVIRLARAGLAPSGMQHGTAVASILIGAPDSRTPGLLPRARLIAIDSFHRQGGDERADVFSLIAALDLLAERGVDVVNLSFAGPPNMTLDAAIRRLDLAGITVVAAAGNSGPRAAAVFPAAYPTVIAVTAVDARGQVYRRAGQGDHIDLAAPGVEVWAAASIRGSRPKTGTSFAAPFVSAAAYLLASAGRNPQEVAAELARLAIDLGAVGPDPVFGHGLLNATALCGSTPD